MTRSREADPPAETFQASILELARDVRAAQELRDAALEKAPRCYEKALKGSVRDAGEFLKFVQKGDVLYERAMQQAFRRYRSARKVSSPKPESPPL